MPILSSTELVRLRQRINFPVYKFNILTFSNDTTIHDVYDINVATVNAKFDNFHRCTTS